MRIPGIKLLAFIAVMAAASDAINERVEEAKNDREKQLRSDHRDLQQFPDIKTAAAVPVPQQANAENVDANVITIESALKTGDETNKEETDEEEEKVTSKNELGYRFNKFQMYPEYVGEAFTLTASDYPLSDDVSHTLAFDSNAYSVVTDHDYRMKGHDIEHYIEAVGGYPARPGTDAYWREFREVVKRARARQLGRLPAKGAFRPPRLWAKMNAIEVADAVHDEYPGTHQSRMIASFITSEEGIKIDHDIIPFRCRDDFIGTDVFLAAMNTWSITSKLSQHE